MKQIVLIVMDVDGTLTDGKIYLFENGGEAKVFNVKDGLGIIKARKNGLVPVIITGRESEIVRRRAKELGIEELYQGIKDKNDIILSLIEKYACSREMVAYIGDDENDLPAIRLCGVSACPCDASEKLKGEVDYVCQMRGGEGAVREFIEYLLSDDKPIGN